MSRRYRIEIAREQFKFSCAHMTVFPNGTKERLHGHNYYVGVTVELADISFAQMVAFGPIKEATTALCRGLREHLLLAADNPYLEIVADTEDELEFRLCGDRYVVPRRDAILLPIDNVAVEPLAAHICDRLVDRLPDLVHRDVVLALEIRVTESPGQGAVCRRTVSSPSASS